MTQAVKIFHENYQGILTHEGWIAVAKPTEKRTILWIDTDKKKVLLKGIKNPVYAEVHKELFPLMDFCKDADTGFVKWKNGGAWLVGFQKTKEHLISDLMEKKYNSDDFKLPNGDWDIISYFKARKEIAEIYEDYEGVCFNDF